MTFLLELLDFLVHADVFGGQVSGDMVCKQADGGLVNFFCFAGGDDEVVFFNFGDQLGVTERGFLVGSFKLLGKVDALRRTSGLWLLPPMQRMRSMRLAPGQDDEGPDKCENYGWL